MVKAIALLLLCTSAHALEIIHDTGNTTPAGPYYRQIRPINEAVVSPRLNMQPDTKPVSLERYFPLTTTLQLGQPAQLQVEQLTAPLFIIGLDIESIEWIEQNLEELTAIGARGVVVSGTDYGSFRQLQHRAEQLGLEINIGPGDAIAKAYGISTYPMLLVRK